MPTPGEKAAMKVREAILARRASEEWMVGKIGKEPEDANGLPLATSDDVEEAVAYIEAVEEEQNAIAAFRALMTP